MPGQHEKLHTLKIRNFENYFFFVVGGMGDGNCSLYNSLHLFRSRNNAGRSWRGATLLHQTRFDKVTEFLSYIHFSTVYIVQYSKALYSSVQYKILMYSTVYKCIKMVSYVHNTDVSYSTVHDSETNC